MNTRINFSHRNTLRTKSYWKEYRDEQQHIPTLRHSSCEDEVRHVLSTSKELGWDHMSDTVAPWCGGDLVSYRFPLLKGEAAHTTICGVAPWRVVANPRHDVAWLCAEDPLT